ENSITFSIAIKNINEYNEECRARWGISGALYLQSATARLNSRLRCGSFMVCHKGLVLTFRSCTTGTHEFCQVWKEAAVSGYSCVPRDCLGCAMNLCNA